LQLLDKNNRLSLTNLAVWVTLVKLALAKDAVQSVDVVALVGSLLSYQAKRFIEPKDSNEVK
jgi:hypothetical protein